MSQPEVAARLSEREINDGIELFEHLDADRFRIGHPHLKFMTQYMKLEHLRAKVIQKRFSEVRAGAPELLEWYSINQPGSFAPVHIRQVGAVAEIMAGRPEAAVKHLENAFLKITGEQSININLLSHFLSQLASELTGRYREAVSQAESAERLLMRNHGPDASEIEQPYFVTLLPASPSPISSSELRVRSQLVEAALQLIDDKLCEPITMTFIARSLHISVRTLQHLFKKDMGTTPSQVLLQKRLDLARNMFLDATTRKTIQEVSEEVGITRTASFARQYRKQFGELPSTTLQRTLSVNPIDHVQG